MRFNKGAAALVLMGVCLSATAQTQAKPDNHGELAPPSGAVVSAAPSEPALVFEGGYKLDVLNLMDGGLQRGAGALGHLDLKLTVDLDQTWGWSGTTAFFNLIHDHGDKFNQNRVGSLTGVSNIEVAVDTERLLQAWIQKEWQEGKYALLAGLYPIDSEFQVVDTAGLFVQPPYGTTGDLALTRGPSVFNNSSFGVRGKWVSDDHAAYAQAAILDGVPGDPGKPKGTHIVFDKDDGTMGIVEIGWRPEGSKYALGMWGYSTQVDDLVDVDNQQNPVQRSSHGAYFLAERTLWKGQSGRSLAGFFRYALNDGDSTALRSIVNTGFVINNPFRADGGDALGLAYTHATLSDKYRALQDAAGEPTSAYESAWELTYRVKLGESFAVQPLVQWHQYPGGGRAVSSATVVGLRMDLSF